MEKKDDTSLEPAKKKAKLEAKFQVDISCLTRLFGFFKVSCTDSKRYEFPDQNPKDWEWLMKALEPEKKKDQGYDPGLAVPPPVRQGDILVVVGGKQFYGESGFLSRWFDYFDAPLNRDHGCKEKETKRFEFPDRDPQEWKWLINNLDCDPFDTNDYFMIESWKDLAVALDWCSYLGCQRGLEFCEKVVANLPLPRPLDGEKDFLKTRFNDKEESYSWFSEIGKGDFACVCRALRVADQHGLRQIIGECRKAMKRYIAHLPNNGLVEVISCFSASAFHPGLEMCDQFFCDPLRSDTVLDDNTLQWFRKQELKNTYRLGCLLTALAKDPSELDSVMNKDLEKEDWDKFISSKLLPKLKNRDRRGRSGGLSGSGWNTLEKIIKVFKAVNRCGLEESKNKCFELFVPYWPWLKSSVFDGRVEFHGSHPRYTFTKQDFTNRRSQVEEKLKELQTKKFHFGSLVLEGCIQADEVEYIREQCKEKPSFYENLEGCNGDFDDQGVLHILQHWPERRPMSIRGSCPTGVGETFEPQPMAGPEVNPRTGGGK